MFAILKLMRYLIGSQWSCWRRVRRLLLLISVFAYTKLLIETFGTSVCLCCVLARSNTASDLKHMFNCILNWPHLMAFDIHITSLKSR